LNFRLTVPVRLDSLEQCEEGTVRDKVFTDHLGNEPGAFAYQLQKLDGKGQIVESIGITDGEFRALQEQLDEMRDPTFVEAIAELVKELARRNDAVGIICRELVRARAEGDQQVMAELLPPVVSLLELIIQAPSVEREAGYVEREILLPEELRKRIDDVAIKLHGGRQKKMGTQNKRRAPERSA
jgi:hypothetical protein